MCTKTKTTVFVPRKGSTVEYHAMITVTDPSLGYKDQLNTVFVLAPVCRPAWLVEMECLALVPFKAPDFRPF